jgi:hypothetical protein
VSLTSRYSSCYNRCCTNSVELRGCELRRTPLLRASVYKDEKEAGSYEANLPTVAALHMSVARRVRAEMLVGRRSGMLGYEAHRKDSHSGGRSWRR